MSVPDVTPKRFVDVFVRIFPKERQHDHRVKPIFETRCTTVERLDGNLTVCNYTCIPKNVVIQDNQPIVGIEVEGRPVALFPLYSSLAYCFGIEEGSTIFRIDLLCIFPYSMEFARRSVECVLRQSLLRPTNG